MTTSEAVEELNRALRAVGSEIATAAHLRELVAWLSRRLGA